MLFFVRAINEIDNAPLLQHAGYEGFLEDFLKIKCLLS